MDAGRPGAGGFAVNSKLISQPSVFLLLADDLWLNPPQEIDPTNEMGDKTGFSTSISNYPAFHLKMSNFLFADNHTATYGKFEPAQMTFWYDAMANWQTNHP